MGKWNIYSLHSQQVKYIQYYERTYRKRDPRKYLPIKNQL